jgi:N utilization substance protein A
MKGARIQTIIRELEGEKIDVLKWDPDPQVFVANALSPAEVRNIIILDEAQRKALAVVIDSQLSLAIGKQGLNVRLANRLTDWNIDVKTVEQYEESGLFSGAKRAAFELFGAGQEEDIYIADIEGIDEAVVKLLADNNISSLHQFYEHDEAELQALGISEEQLSALYTVFGEYVEFEEEPAETAPASTDTAEPAAEAPAPDMADAEAPAEAGGAPETAAAPLREAPAEAGADALAEAPADVEEYECPHCNGILTGDMVKCPSCGAEIDWE